MDITGKSIVPLVDKTERTFTANVLGAKRVAKADDQVRHLEKTIQALGSYSYCTTSEEMEQLRANSEKMDNLFSQLMTRRVKRWIEIAEERLSGTGKKCLIMPGNDDQLCVDDALEESDYVLNPEGKLINSTTEDLPPNPA